MAPPVVHAVPPAAERPWPRPKRLRAALIGHRSRVDILHTRVLFFSMHRADRGTSGSRARLPHGHQTGSAHRRTPALCQTCAAARGNLESNAVAAALTASTRVRSRDGATRRGARPRGQRRARCRAPRRRRRRVNAGAGGHRRAAVAPHAAHSQGRDAAGAGAAAPPPARRGGLPPPPPPPPRARANPRNGRPRSAPPPVARPARAPPPPDRRP